MQQEEIINKAYDLFNEFEKPSLFTRERFGDVHKYINSNYSSKKLYIHERPQIYTAGGPGNRWSAEKRDTGACGFWR